MFDCAIIGTGPAGLSAALNLKLHNKSFVWFGSKTMSDKVRRSEQIANYPGAALVSGEELHSSFVRQAQQMELTITDKMVSQIMAGKDGYTLLADNEIFDARTIIFATGVVTSRTIPGEEALLGRGVSYCATCDGFLYRDKTIGVVCYASRFEHEIQYLAQLAQRVYLFPYYKDCGVSGDNICVLRQKIERIQGEQRLTSLTLGDGTQLPLDGLFCMRDAIAPSTLLHGIGMEAGQIVVDRTMATNLAGCFAAGDCTGGPYQIAKAVGEGNVAAHSVIAYLAAGQ